eukprot:365934-Chlamydomonas_euryale.AAC.6
MQSMHKHKCHGGEESRLGRMISKQLSGVDRNSNPRGNLLPRWLKMTHGHTHVCAEHGDMQLSAC